MTDDLQWMVSDASAWGRLYVFFFTETNFWFPLGLTYKQQNARKPSHASSDLVNATFPVVWEFCWCHTAKCPGVHAQLTRRANVSLLDQQWHGTWEACAARSRGSPMIIKQIISRDNFACDVRTDFGLENVCTVRSFNSAASFRIVLDWVETTQTCWLTKWRCMQQRNFSSGYTNFLGVFTMKFKLKQTIINAFLIIVLVDDPGVYNPGMLDGQNIAQRYIIKKRLRTTAEVL